MTYRPLQAVRVIRWYRKMSWQGQAVGSLHVYYHPAWEKAFINASNLKGKIRQVVGL
ncbi:MAG: hypothetical protein IPI23_15745 [Bacteroidetes bacterium]|nr:hypothetical protein [Bacteroidota bacterium]